MELKEVIKSNKNITGITMWDGRNQKAVIRCLKDDEILVEDLIHKLGLTLVKVTGGFNNPEKISSLDGIKIVNKVVL